MVIGRFRILALVLIAASAHDARAQVDIAAVRATKQLEALRIDEPIVIDGELDEPAWMHAQVGRDFYQQEPDAGALTTEPSEIRFLYDDDALYFAGTFFDSDPRGPIVDELALIEALRAGTIAGAGLDVFEQEPIAADNPLLNMDNVLLAPHSLCWTDECFDHMAREGLGCIVDFAQGKTPKSIVKPG